MKRQRKDSNNKFNGPTMTDRLEWLYDHADSLNSPEGGCPLGINWDTVNHGHLHLQGFGFAIVLTETGWHLEDTTGG